MTGAFGRMLLQRGAGSAVVARSPASGVAGDYRSGEEAPWPERSRNCLSSSITLASAAAARVSAAAARVSAARRALASARRASASSSWLSRSQPVAGSRKRISRPGAARNSRPRVRLRSVSVPSRAVAAVDARSPTASAAPLADAPADAFPSGRTASTRARRGAHTRTASGRDRPATCWARPPRGRRPAPEPGTRYCSSARYQIGEVHARSWILQGRSGAMHAAGRSSSGRAAHCSAFQRQLGFSTTRA